MLKFRLRQNPQFQCKKFHPTSERKNPCAFRHNAVPRERGIVPRTASALAFACAAAAITISSDGQAESLAAKISPVPQQIAAAPQQIALVPGFAPGQIGLAPVPQQIGFVPGFAPRQARDPANLSAADYRSAGFCQALGGLLENDNRICSEIDINDTFCIIGRDGEDNSALPCLGLFRHVNRCNFTYNRPALDPFHCAAACDAEAEETAVGRKCLAPVETESAVVIALTEDNFQGDVYAINTELPPGFQPIVLGSGYLRADPDGMVRMNRPLDRVLEEMIQVSAATLDISLRLEPVRRIDYELNAPAGRAFAPVNLAGGALASATFSEGASGNFAVSPEGTLSIPGGDLVSAGEARVDFQVHGDGVLGTIAGRAFVRGAEAVPSGLNFDGTDLTMHGQTFDIANADAADPQNTLQGVYWGRRRGLHFVLVKTGDIPPPPGDFAEPLNLFGGEIGGGLYARNAAGDLYYRPFRAGPAASPRGRSSGWTMADYAALCGGRGAGWRAPAVGEAAGLVYGGDGDGLALTYRTTDIGVLLDIEGHGLNQLGSPRAQAAWESVGHNVNIPGLIPTRRPGDADANTHQFSWIWENQISVAALAGDDWAALPFGAAVAAANGAPAGHLPEHPSSWPAGQMWAVGLAAAGEEGIFGAFTPESGFGMAARRRVTVPQQGRSESHYLQGLLPDGATGYAACVLPADAASYQPPPELAVLEMDYAGKAVKCPLSASPSRECGDAFDPATGRVDHALADISQIRLPGVVARDAVIATLTVRARRFGRRSDGAAALEPAEGEARRARLSARVSGGSGLETAATLVSISADDAMAVYEISLVGGGPLSQEPDDYLARILVRASPRVGEPASALFEISVRGARAPSRPPCGSGQVVLGRVVLHPDGTREDRRICVDDHPNRAGPNTVASVYVSNDEANNVRVCKALDGTVVRKRGVAYCEGNFGLLGGPRAANANEFCIFKAVTGDDEADKDSCVFAFDSALRCNTDPFNRPGRNVGESNRTNTCNPDCASGEVAVGGACHSEVEPEAPFVRVAAHPIQQSVSLPPPPPDLVSFVPVRWDLFSYYFGFGEEPACPDPHVAGKAHGSGVDYGFACVMANAVDVQCLHFTRDPPTGAFVVATPLGDRVFNPAGDDTYNGPTQGENVKLCTAAFPPCVTDGRVDGRDPYTANCSKADFDAAVAATSLEEVFRPTLEGPAENSNFIFRQLEIGTGYSGPILTVTSLAAGTALQVREIGSDAEIGLVGGGVVALSSPLPHPILKGTAKDGKRGHAPAEDFEYIHREGSEAAVTLGIRVGGGSEVTVALVARPLALPPTQIIYQKVDAVEGITGGTVMIVVGGYGSTPPEGSDAPGLLARLATDFPEGAGVWRDGGASDSVRILPDGRMVLADATVRYDEAVREVGILNTPAKREVRLTVDVLVLEDGETPLRKAILAGDPAAVRALAGAGAGLEGPDGDYPLHLALKARPVSEEIVVLVAEAALEVVQEFDRFGLLPIELAILANLSADALRLLEPTSGLEAPFVSGDYPLHLALRNGAGSAAAEFLLAESPESLMRTGANGDYPLHAALKARPINLEGVRWALNQNTLALGLRNRARLLPLQVAAAAVRPSDAEYAQATVRLAALGRPRDGTLSFNPNLVEAASILLDAGADADARVTHPHTNGADNALGLAFRLGLYGQLRDSHKCGDDAGFVNEDLLRMVKLLRDAGASPNYLDRPPLDYSGATQNHRWSVLHVAAEYFNKGMVEVALEYLRDGPGRRDVTILNSGRGDQTNGATDGVTPLDILDSFDNDTDGNAWEGSACAAALPGRGAKLRALGQALVDMGAVCRHRVSVNEPGATICRLTAGP